MLVSKNIKVALTLLLSAGAGTAYSAVEQEPAELHKGVPAELHEKMSPGLYAEASNEATIKQQIENRVKKDKQEKELEELQDKMEQLMGLASELKLMRQEKEAMSKELEEQRELIRKLTEDQAERKAVSPELTKIRTQEEFEQRVAAEVQKAMQNYKSKQNESVRVKYVPDFLLEEIREQVKMELKEEVAQEIVDGVYDESTEDGLPIPEVPEWTDTISMKGDIRIRTQNEMPHSDSGSWVDYQAVNKKGKNISTTSVDVNDILLNPNNDDRDRSRVRLRLDAEAKFGYNMKAGARFTTGSSSDPVSTNQTLGTGNNKYDVVLDRAYLNYKWVNDSDDLTVSLTGGRMHNPWFSTDLVWDSDLGFEGFAGSLNYKRSRASKFAGMTLRDYNVRGTLGAFPLEEVSSNGRDKWLLGAQMEASARFLSMNQLRFGVGYYEYINETGVAHSSPFSMRDSETDATVPVYMQKGNTLFDVYPDALALNPSDDVDMFGLASEFKLLNLTATYEMLELDPTRLWITADYVKNLAWDANETLNRIGGVASYATNPLEGDHDTGYMVKLEAGTKNQLKPGDWRAFMGYRYLEPDAVPDAYTDSDFHFGGTNSKGWFLGGKYYFEDNTYIGFRYLSAQQVMIPNDVLLLGTTSDTLDMDTMQIDIIGKF